MASASFARVSVLQCVAVCCSVLQCFAERRIVLQYDAVWCSAVRCGIVSRSVLQCVAVQCSVFECVGLCCMNVCMHVYLYL